MKGVIVLLFLIVSLVCIIPAQSFGAGDHPYVLEWGEFGITKDGQFLRPQHLAADDEENIYVADTGNAKIQKFSSDGKFLLSFGVRGDENGEFGSPVGIATHENNIYVVDSHLNSIKKFDSDGNFILKWGEEGSEDGKFSSPRGIEIDSEGVVYVVDTKNYRIQKFTTDGEFLSSFGSYGTTDERLRAPEDVTIYENNIYVSDPRNYKIIKFTSDGIFLKSFDYNMGGFPIRPYGLVSDLDGNVYFADSAKHRIVKIDSEGNSLTMWGQAGNAKGHFVEPIGIAFNNLGYLFVTDSSNNRIQKFQTPLVVEMQEALAAEQAEKLKELAYSEDTETEDNDQNVIPEKPFVRDLTKPVLVAPKDITIEATGSLTPVDIGEAMAMDENGIQFLINNAPEMFSLGTSIIIWTAVDNSGNSSFATQEVNVVDTTPPIISSISDKIVEAVSPYQNIVKLEVPDADDILGVISVTSDAPEFFLLGETIVTWTSTDIAGNTASTEQRIILIDETSPVLQLPEDLVVEATSSDQNEVSLGDATATDNIDIASVINDAPDTFPLGETVVTWTATDSSGNTATATQTVSVVDTTAPEILPVGDVTIEATSIAENTASLDNPSVLDVQEISLTNNAPEFFPLGETIVTWTSTDVAGNTVSMEQKVLVVDTTVPTLTIPPDLNVEAVSLQETSVAIGQATADDISDISSIANNSPDVFPLGITVVTWNATDSYGNIATSDQIITVIDTIPPTLFVPEDIVFEVVDPVSNYIELGQAETTDQVGIESVTNDMPDSFPFGSTTITWTVIDTSGNVSTDTQVVTIIDTSGPKISLPSDIIVEATGLSDTDVELGDATAYDIIQVDTITNDAPGTFPLGETVVTWTATDSSGNTATATQTVSVVDTTAPSIIAPDGVELEATSSGSIVDIGNPVYDDLVDIASVINDAPDTFPLGETVVTWTATDSSGNTATATQTVSVVDTTAPELIIPENIIVDSITIEKLVEIGEANAIDLVDTLPAVTNDAPEIFPLGDTIVTWSVADQFGNSASLQQIVSVQVCGQSISYYNQILGTAEDDILMGTDASDLIFAFNGDDMIFGGEGNDCIIGGEGDDLIFGNAGNDHLVGGEGSDIIKGNSGDDKLTGGLGFDIIDGGDGSDVSYDSVSDIVIKCEEQL